MKKNVKKRTKKVWSPKTKETTFSYCFDDDVFLYHSLRLGGPVLAYCEGV